MTWMLPKPTSMTSHIAHWVSRRVPFSGEDTYRAACGALVGPRVEQEPGERCGRCEQARARLEAD